MRGNRTCPHLIYLSNQGIKQIPTSLFSPLRTSITPSHHWHLFQITLTTGTITKRSHQNHHTPPHPLFQNTPLRCFWFLKANKSILSRHTTSVTFTTISTNYFKPLSCLILTLKQYNFTICITPPIKLRNNFLYTAFLIGCTPPHDFRDHNSHTLRLSNPSLSIFLRVELISQSSETLWPCAHHTKSEFFNFYTQIKSSEHLMVPWKP
jgi:hypothetical protein